MVAAVLRRVPPVAWQGLRFGIVGVGNTLTTFAVIWLVHDFFGGAVWLASATGYAVSMVLSYILNRWWTFGAGGTGRLGKQALAFVAVNLVCLGVFTALNATLAERWSLPVASVATMLVVVPLAFVLTRTFVFRPIQRPLDGKPGAALGLEVDLPDILTDDTEAEQLNPADDVDRHGDRRPAGDRRLEV